MNFYLRKSVQAYFTSPPENHTTNCFPCLTKHTFFAMLKKTKGNP